MAVEVAERVERDLFLLDEAARLLYSRGRDLAFKINESDELIEDLLQIIIALFYEIEVLKSKLAITA